MEVICEVSRSSDVTYSRFDSQLAPMIAFCFVFCSSVCSAYETLHVEQIWTSDYVCNMNYVLHIWVCFLQGEHFPYEKILWSKIYLKNISLAFYISYFTSYRLDKNLEVLSEFCREALIFCSLDALEWNNTAINVLFPNTEITEITESYSLTTYLKLLLFM